MTGIAAVLLGVHLPIVSFVQGQSQRWMTAWRPWKMKRRLCGRTWSANGTCWAATSTQPNWPPTYGSAKSSMSRMRMRCSTHSCCPPKSTEQVIIWSVAPSASLNSFALLSLERAWIKLQIIRWKLFYLIDRRFDVQGDSAAILIAKTLSSAVKTGARGVQIPIKALANVSVNTSSSQCHSRSSFLAVLQYFVICDWKICHPCLVKAAVNNLSFEISVPETNLPTLLQNNDQHKLMELVALLFGFSWTHLISQILHSSLLGQRGTSGMWYLLTLLVGLMCHQSAVCTQADCWTSSTPKARGATWCS